MAVMVHRPRREFNYVGRNARRLTTV